MHTKRKLIELIKKHKELYNTTLSEYKDITSRNEAWNQIAEEMEMTVEECKADWNKLRNCYVNALRRRVSLHHRQGRSLPPWLYETEMSFLKPFMTGRGYDDTPYTVLLPEHTFNFEEDTIMVKDDEVMEKKRKKTPKSPTNDTFNYEDSTSVKDDIIQIEREKNRKKLRTPKLEVEDTYEILDTNDILETCEPYKSRRNYQDIINEMDESDLFFLGLSQTFKKLPKIEQCRLKMDIFKTMNDAEMRQLEAMRKRKRRSSSESS